jgi:ubiquinone/menaquinone biosynthesis C-methylase UbiE
MSETKATVNTIELEVLARQLRKPEGKMGIQVAERMNQGNAAMNLHTLAVVNAQPQDQLLEIGMGNGFFVKNLLNLHPTIRYTGLDYSGDMVEAAKQLNESYIQEGRAAFLHGDILENQLPSAHFSKIFTINTIYFWQDVQNTLYKLKSLLLPAGELILAFRPEHNMKTLAVTQFNFQFFTAERVQQQLSECGFINIETTFIKEPPQMVFEKLIEKETVVVKATVG